jgi:hypothetical protein
VGFFNSHGIYSIKYITMRAPLNEEINRIKSMMLIKEDVSGLEFEETNQDLVDMGENPVTPEEAEALVNCTDDDVQDVPAEHQSTLQKVKSAINSTNDREVLKNAFKQVRSLMKSKKNVQQEQAAAIAATTVLGVPIGTAALMFVGALILLSIIGRLLTGPREPRERRRGSCRAEDRRFKRMMNKTYY